MKCQNAINEIQKIIKKEKAARAKKIKIISIITVSVIAISVAFVIVLNKVIIPNQKYNKALSLKEEAISAFEELDGYKDSDEILQSIKPEYEQIILEKADVGDIVIFGAYEQDGDESNGEEDIEWIVLAKKEGKALVISKYALDCRPYNVKREDVTWETCSLRRWMNETFLDLAFSSDEQERILNTNVSADKNPEYETDPGNPTTDKVFLLSITEVEEYFTSDDARACKPTEYAKTNGAAENIEGFCWWWLRWPGSYQESAAIVSSDGSVSCYGSSVIIVSDCVRPALWINLDS